MYKLILTRKVYQTTKKNTTCFPVTWFTRQEVLSDDDLLPMLQLAQNLNPEMLIVLA